MDKVTKSFPEERLEKEEHEKKKAKKNEQETGAAPRIPEESKRMTRSTRNKEEEFQSILFFSLSRKGYRVEATSAADENDLSSEEVI